MNWGRWFRHAFATKYARQRAFPLSSLIAIEAAITESERWHSAEIRFAIEGAIEPGDVWYGKTARERALEIFAALGVWDTEQNNGVLIYVLLADKRVEIVADRGFNDRVAEAEWAVVCDAMEAMFESNRYLDGALEGVRLTGQILERHFPPRADGRNENELPNRPFVL